ncbi:MAG: carbamoyltransferase HypF, partial [Chthoniobacterales bacterium]
QPNACPECGPQLALWNGSGETIALRAAALTQAVEAVRAGKILALKALGGFQLVVDATNDEAIVRLRARKHREEKPFAVMVSSLGAARKLCRVSEIEARLFESAEAPIVLLTKKSVLPESVAPRNPNLGLMLPSTPLHHLFLHSLGAPIIATSGNLRDEPICTDEQETVERLGGIADLFLVHDRPIVRQMDDSIARIIADREMILRRARGYAPLPIPIRKTAAPILALGAHLTNTVALGVGGNVFVSQHIGDLATGPAYRAFVRAAADLPRLYETAPAMITCDLHPDYLSTKYAAEFSLPVRAVQHHWAHIAACMAENELTAPLLGVSWDGTGYGDDGTIWGGEFLRANAEGNFTRVAHLRPFRLPGGAAAVKEPRRSALGLLFEIFGDELWGQHDLLEQFDPSELALLRQILEKQINSPVTTSAGRLFDAVAALLDLRARTSFEGQAAMELEFAIEPADEKFYPFELRGASPLVIDWQPMISAIIADRRAAVSRSVIAAGFHNTLAEMIVAVARQTGEEKVALSGGCFQNRYLIERTIARLSAEGFRVYWPQRIPPNDGGISLGQVFAVSLLR